MSPSIDWQGHLDKISKDLFSIIKFFSSHQRLLEVIYSRNLLYRGDLRPS